MFNFNCTNYLNNESDYSKPVPWIGLYIAAASLCCAILGLADLVTAYQRSQIWVPSRYFALNASSLTVLSVATKLSVDLNTTMPRQIDQLAKLSTSVLICVSIAHFIPSLGKMVIANLIALVVLVITSVVNLFIQLYTGVIYAFIVGHACLLAIMIYSLMVCCCTGIALASMKNELRVMYDSMHQAAIKELRNENGATLTSKQLEEYLEKFSVMSHSGWPHFVLGRSVLYRMSAYICVLVLYLYILTFSSYVRKFRMVNGHFCDDESDYEWSTSLIFGTQMLATLGAFIVQGAKLVSVPSAEKIRILPAITNQIKAERYWIQLPVEIRERSFFLYIHNKRCRKYVYHAKNTFCNFLIAIQIAMVFITKCHGLLYDLFARYPLLAIQRRIHQIINPNYMHSHSTFRSVVDLGELKKYILYIKGEEDIIEPMLRTTLDTTRKYIEEGKREEPTYLVDCLKTCHSPGFLGVFLFDINRVPHFDFDSKSPPSNCWSLSVVTLTSLAVLLPDVDSRNVKKLLKAIKEGLMFVKKIEENLNGSIHFVNKRKAADKVWQEVDIHGRRLDVEFKELVSHGNNPINILRFLADSAKPSFQASDPSKKSTSIWTIEAVASYCLYGVCETILLDSQDGNNQFETTNDLFEMLSSRIGDILGACLTNLKNSILVECSRSTVENMNETARSVLILFGRTEKIMEQVNGREIPHLNSNQLAFIDEWRTSTET